MPAWGQLLVELEEIAAQVTAAGKTNVSPFDVLRRKYLGQLHAHTGPGGHHLRDTMARIEG